MNAKHGDNNDTLAFNIACSVSKSGDAASATAVSFLYQEARRQLAANGRQWLRQRKLRRQCVGAGEPVTSDHGRRSPSTRSVSESQTEANEGTS